MTGPSPSSPVEARTSAWHALRNSLLSLRRIHRDATTSHTRRPSDRGNFIFSSRLIPHSAPMSHQRSSMFPSQIRRLHVLHVRRQAPRSSGRNIWNTQTRVSSVRSANDGASSVADRDRVATMARVGSAVQGRGNIPTFADILLLARSPSCTVGKSRTRRGSRKEVRGTTSHSRTRRRVRARIDTRVDRTRRARPVENAAEAQREGRRSEARGSKFRSREQKESAVVR